MKVGVWIESDFAPTEGGGFSYIDKLVKAMDEYTFHPSLEICFVHEGEEDDIQLKREVVNLKWNYKISLWERLLLRIPIVSAKMRSKLSKKKHVAYRRILRQHGVHVLYYLRQLDCHVPGFPFVMTNWDIGHSSTYAFPELVTDGYYNFEVRSNFYVHVLPQALFVFAESEAGKQELIRYTNIADFKIKVVPIFAGNSVLLQVPKEQQIEILNSYGLTPNHYFFYPAQFWAHKNHYNLLLAFSQFVEIHPDYKLVLTGSDKGNLDYIQKTIQKLNLKDKVVFPGFVPMEHINTFYKNATALVMASYFGPTNMPPIEAMELGCPVICSELTGHREILDDAAIYFDPMFPDMIANAMEQMLKNRESYEKRITDQRLKSKFNIDVALQNINKYLQELIPIRSTWA